MTAPEPEVVLPSCPRCGQPVDGYAYSAGWAVQSWEGTRVGNWDDAAPPVGQVHPFPVLDRATVTPCGDVLNDLEWRRLRVAIAEMAR